MTTLQINDTVKFTTKAIQFYKDKLDDAEFIKNYGMTLAKSALAKHQLEHKVTRISSDNSNNLVYFLSGMKGGTLATNLIKITK